MDPLSNSYCGLGFQLELRDITPLPQNSLTPLSSITDQHGWFLSIPPIYSLNPAQTAGLQHGDQLLAYYTDGEWRPLPSDPTQLPNILRGPQGSQIALRISRDGVEHDITVTRDAIALLREEGGFEPRILEDVHYCEALTHNLPLLPSPSRGRA